MFVQGRANRSGGVLRLQSTVIKMNTDGPNGEVPVVKCLCGDAGSETGREVALDVTIIIINYNYGKFLRQAIDSAISQTKKAVEIVVVDDGSIDDSRSIINSYGSLVHPIFKDQGGHVSAVNEGFLYGSGQICIFLDADDILYPNFVEALEALWRPGVSKIQFRLDTIDHLGLDQDMTFPIFLQILLHLRSDDKRSGLVSILGQFQQEMLTRGVILNKYFLSIRLKYIARLTVI